MADSDISGLNVGGIIPGIIKGGPVPRLNSGQLDPRFLEGLTPSVIQGLENYRASICEQALQSMGATIGDRERTDLARQLAALQRNSWYVDMLPLQAARAETAPVVLRGRADGDTYRVKCGSFIASIRHDLRWRPRYVKITDVLKGISMLKEP